MRQTTHYPLQGGLDFVSSPLTVSPGRLWTSLNYVPADGGYRRVNGYERFDGRLRPSGASYWIMAADNPVAGAGETLTGASSGATATVLAEAGGEYILGELSGLFTVGESLTGSVTAAAGTARGTARKTGAATVELDLSYRDLAASHRRSAIEAVPGSGPVRGVWLFKNKVYAVRNNADGSAGVLWRATDGGWQQAASDPVYTLAFDGGSRQLHPRDTIEGGTSGASARVVTVRVTSGAWADSDAAGEVTIEAITGTFADDEALNVGGQAAATADGTVTQAAYSLPADGRYDFHNHNFLGQAGGEIMIGVNGVGQAFIWDETTLRPIDTGRTQDTPNHVTVHRNHLVLGYVGGSIQISATGDPLDWSALRGAAEIACGQDVVALVGGVGVGNTLIIGLDRVQALYGNDSSDFQLADHSQGQTGGIEWTVQTVGGPLYMDNRGVRSVATTEAYGNFVIGTMTSDIQPWIDRQREERNLPVASMRVRSEDQYRVFFESGLGLVIYLGRGQPELAFIEYGVPMRCTVSAEDADRIERVYFGSDDGWVFEAERGRSFDGREIEAYVRLPLNHVGSPTSKKRYFKADLHLDLGSAIRLSGSALFDDGDAPDQLEDEHIVRGGGGLWNEAAWDEFYFDAPLNGYGEFHLNGIGRNVSLLLLSRTKTEAAHTLNGVSLHFAPRRLER